MKQTIEEVKEQDDGFIFTNLVDFDAKWGHRRNPIGHGKELEAFDKKLGELLQVLKEDDLLILCADHGNDPVHYGTDHTKEKVPLMIYSKQFKESHPIKEQENFATIGATILDNFRLKKPEHMIGTSILEQLK